MSREWHASTSEYQARSRRLTCFVQGGGPEPRPGEIRVLVEACGINDPDGLIIDDPLPLRARFQKSADAIRAAKRLLTIADDSMAERVLTAEAVEQTSIMSQPNQIETVLAAQGRPANFVE